MAWITPKVNWDTVPINPTSTDLNRIEGNLDFLKTDIETKKGAIVDALNEVGVATNLADAHSVIAANILAAEKTSISLTPSTSDVAIPKGIYDTSGGIVVGDADLIASNIKIGKNLFGVVGNVQELEYKAGSTHTASSIAEISSTIAGNTEVNFGKVTIYPKGTIRIKGVFTADTPGSELERYEIKLLKNGVQFGDTILTTQPVGEYDRDITSWSFDVPITATTTLQLRVKNRSVYNKTPKTSIQATFDYFSTIASAITV